MSGQFLLLLCFIEIPVTNANSVDPDQMLSSLASNRVHIIMGPVKGKTKPSSMHKISGFTSSNAYARSHRALLSIDTFYSIQ